MDIILPTVSCHEFNKDIPFCRKMSTPDLVKQSDGLLVFLWSNIESVVTCGVFVRWFLTCDLV